jgi:hypothetical protein
MNDHFQVQPADLRAVAAEFHDSARNIACPPGGPEFGELGPTPGGVSLTAAVSGVIQDLLFLHARVAAAVDQVRIDLETAAAGYEQADGAANGGFIQIEVPGASPGPAPTSSPNNSSAAR